MATFKQSEIGNFRCHLTELRGIYFTRILKTFYASSRNSRPRALSLYLLAVVLICRRVLLNK